MKRAKKILQYQHSEFNLLNKSAMWLGNLAVIFITPFVIHNFLNGRLEVAFAAFFVIGVFLFNTISILFWDKYHSSLALVLLAPAVFIFLYISIPRQGIIGVLWSFPALVLFYYLLPQKQARYINAIGLILCTYLVWFNFEQGLAIRIITILTVISVFTAVNIQLINSQQIALHRLAITDSLTGLYNRNTLNKVLNEIISNKGNLTGTNHILTLDIDHFKTINDRFGHDQGDHVLIILANTIKDTVGDHGVVFRHGGEEFIAIIEQLSWEKAQELSELIRLTIESLELFPNFSTTLSIGLSRLKPNMTRMEWIRESDQNLYLAKNQGRNQIVAS